MNRSLRSVVHVVMVLVPESAEVKDGMRHAVEAADVFACRSCRIDKFFLTLQQNAYVDGIAAND